MRYLRIFGKFLISVGVGILMFVAWTLWGTALYESQQQNELEAAFDAAPPIAAVASDPDEPNYLGPPDSFRPGPGEGVFRLKIPAIDLTKMVVQGVGTEELKRGPGHYPDCRGEFEPPLCTEFEEVWPGEKGRVVVSGHRTTYGQPFWNLDRLKPGDKIVTETKWGDFTYEVTELAVVQPTSRSIVIDRNEAELVLTTCNPKFSAAQRLIVYADLVTEVADV